MPFPTEHAAKIKDSGSFDDVRRKNNWLGDGIHALFGINDDGEEGHGTTEIIAIRFDKEKFSAAEARQWLSDNDFKTTGFEPAGPKGAESKALVEIDLVITKANIDENGNFRWLVTASDTGPDRTGERTSLALFQDWIERVEKGTTTGFLPPPRRPFLGLSHYPDLDGYGEAGITDKLYIDGQQFKAGGLFYTDDAHPLGPKLFEAVSSERDFIKKGGAVEEPIRISAAWWDLQHSHGDFIFTRQSLADKCPMCRQGAGDKQYLKGQLDHFASTRVPINPRTDLTLEEKSMAKTRKDDAASIIDDPELVEELDKRAKLVGKSEADDDEGLVIKGKEFGAAIRKKREEMEMSLADVAKGLPITADTLGDIESGEIDTPSDPVIKALAKTLKMDEKTLRGLLSAGAKPGAKVGTVGEAEEEKAELDDEAEVIEKGKGKPFPGAAAPFKKGGGRKKKDDEDEEDDEGEKKAKKGPANKGEKKLPAFLKGDDEEEEDEDTKGKKKTQKSEFALTIPEDFDPAVLDEATLTALSEAGLIEQRYEGEGMVERPPMPFGGATDLGEAEAFIESREKMDKMHDNWGMFMAIVANIMSMTPEDGELESDVNSRKLAKLGEVTGEFSDRIDSLKAGLADAYLLQPVTDATLDDPLEPSVEIKRSQTMSEKTNDIYDVLKAQVEDAIKNPELDRENKAEVIQKAMEQFAGGLRGQLDQAAPPDYAALVSGEVQKALTPITEQLALITEKLTTGPAQAPAQPVQKSLQPTAVGGPTAQNYGQARSIKDIARQSVGLPQ